LGSVLLAVALANSGCVAKLLETGTKNPVIRYNDILVYEKPFDYTYLGVVKAVDRVPGWRLSNTDKMKGVVTARNEEYEDLFDKDKREITVLVKRIDRKRTSVELAPESQTMLGARVMLQAIQQNLGR
jgi:hypothetical protein